MKTDHFAEFRRRLPPEIKGNKGDRVTIPEKHREARSFSSGDSVTQISQPRVTRVTRPAQPIGPDSDVTRVTQVSTAWVTGRESQKTKQTQGNLESVTRVTRVTYKNSTDGRGHPSPRFDDGPAFPTERGGAQEAKIDQLATDGVMLLADAIASAPRAPFENDSAMAKAARFAVTTSRLLRELTGARLGEAQALCADTARAAAHHIRRRNYLGAYELLDELPAKLRTLIPQ